MKGVQRDNTGVRALARPIIQFQSPAPQMGARTLPGVKLGTLSSDPKTEQKGKLEKMLNKLSTTEKYISYISPIIYKVRKW